MESEERMREKVVNPRWYQKYTFREIRILKLEATCASLALASGLDIETVYDAEVIEKGLITREEMETLLAVINPLLRRSGELQPDEADLTPEDLHGFVPVLE